MDLRTNPLRLNDGYRLTSDSMQWIVQRRTKRGTWVNYIFCMTREGLLTNLTYKVFDVGPIEEDARRHLETLPDVHSRPSRSHFNVP